MAGVLPPALKIRIKQIKGKHREWRESISYTSGNDVYSELKSHIQMYRTQKKKKSQIKSYPSKKWDLDLNI